MVPDPRSAKALQQWGTGPKREGVQYELLFILQLEIFSIYMTINSLLKSTRFEKIPI
ncbi:MAG: hypothetical protein K0Q87_2355 [Neobacillus sp.]|nr:hypothetical protein [Neobacillus sp.]